LSDAPLFFEDGVFDFQLKAFRNIDPATDTVVASRQIARKCPHYVTEADMQRIYGTFLLPFFKTRSATDRALLDLADAVALETGAPTPQFKSRLQALVRQAFCTREGKCMIKWFKGARNRSFDAETVDSTTMLVLSRYDGLRC
jgi:hypothetical protein